jgi:hypothetical protein
MVRSSRNNGNNLFVCCADCILGCIESVVEYFNKWAYIYVGLYGFSFMEAGSNVMTLFRNRGWTSIITDVVVDTVLRMLSAAVGFLSALFFVLIMYLVFTFDGSIDFSEMDQGMVLVAFSILAIVPFGIGYSMAITVFSVIGSAVNTVIVCYAEAPNEFQTNHPQLSELMTNGWRQAYPDEFDN